MDEPIRNDERHPAKYWHTLGDGRLQCDICPRDCKLHEGQRGVCFVRGMAENLESASTGDQSALHLFVENGLSYVLLLRAHIQKEDNILFPMAARLMSEEEQAALLKQFDVVESDHMGTGTHERFLELAEALAKKYNVEHTWTAATTKCACSHHH